MAFTGVFHIASVLAAAAFLALPCGNMVQGGRVTPRRMVAATLAIAAFFFLPSGSLPPLMDIPYGAVFFLCFLSCALLVTGNKSIWVPWVSLCSIFGVFVWFFHSRGVPGSVFTFGTYVAMPFWHFVTVAEGAGCVFLAGIAFVFVRRIIREVEGSGFCGTLAGMGVCAVWVSLFIPFNVAPVFTLPERALASVDAVLFWGKIIGVYRLSQCVPSGNPLPGKPLPGKT